MARSKQQFGEGDWIAIPLPKRGGWGVGLIARMRSPSLVGYFFGPRRDVPPTLADVVALRPEDALLIANASDLGLRSGEWLALGSLPGWHRQAWPMPRFGTQEGERYYINTYDEDAPNRLLRQERATREQVAALPPDVASGHIALAIKLDKAIAGPEDRTAA